jgi:hypothetical protein
VDLPRERSFETRELERYFELVTAVREGLREGEAGSSRPGAQIKAEGLSA